MQTTSTLTTVRRAPAAGKALRLPQGLLAGVAFLLVGAALALGYRLTGTPVVLVVDGQERRLLTHQDTISALLLEAGVAWDATDRVLPAPDTLLQANQTQVVVVQRPHLVLVTADGQTLQLKTHAVDPEEILREARVSLGPYDELEFSGDLRAPQAAGAAGKSSAPAPASLPRLTVRRAIAFTLVEDQLAPRILYSTASTVGEALYRAGLLLYDADYVKPGLGEPLRAGALVSVAHSTPVSVAVDGKHLRTRTHRERVDAVLADLGIVLTGEDYTTPTLDSPLNADVTVQVVRVTERYIIQEEPIAYDSVWQPDPELEIDNQRLVQEGAPGTLQQRVRIRYEDGVERERFLEGEFVAVPPTTKIEGYGTKIVIRSLDTPAGTVEYWRVIRMLATSYSASTSGTSPSASWYGRTATGMKMGFGIVAVDPRIINLRSQVYVPDYGIGIAGDTGGAIKGRRIDLGYDDANLRLWYRWVDVYLLTPVPANIDYTLGLNQ